jgi:TRAP-type transport system periplasmic protein
MPGRIASALLALAMGWLALPGCAAAEDKPVQLKLSHWVPPSHPLQAAIEDWANAVKADSHGSITAVIFPAEQLGKAFDHYDMARDGIADGAYVNPGYQPGRFPIIAASDLPFQYHDAKTGTAALDAWYRDYASREMKDVKYCFAFIHDPSTLHSRRKVVAPNDLRGMKIRPSNAMMGSFVTLLGGNNVQASAPAARDLLERGVAEGIFFPWASLVLFGIDKVTKYHIDANFYASTFVWVLNKARYESLAPAQRKVIDDHCNTEWAVRFAGPWADFEAAGRAKLQAEPGQEIVALSPAQLDDWRRAAEPLHAKWAAEVRRIGQDPDSIYKALQASLAQHHAAY